MTAHGPASLAETIDALRASVASCCERRPARAKRPRLASAAIGVGALLLAVSSDVEPRTEQTPCRVAGLEAQVFAGSRLFDAPDERLELLAGRALGCDDAAVQRVLRAIGLALKSLPAPRTAAPLRVHLDPRLPPRQAPLAGIEVHVSRRELLVARSMLDQLEPQAWRHELVHARASAPPEAAVELRRLWLTVEEGVVMHVASASTPFRGGPYGPAELLAAESRWVLARPSSQRVLPVQALLASAAYDPHPLAAGLAQELGREAAAPIDAWLDCLSARPPELPADAALHDVFRTFAARCSHGTASELTAAIERWWGT
jgi:hypothetical protein